ncbi:hypothetical protein SNE510_76070 [Streptomyces sp. NE5-10]|nr:hypothetical protein SNE510_76070 [Streptomyces sp. NE5-10]
MLMLPVRVTAVMVVMWLVTAEDASAEAAGYTGRSPRAQRRARVARLVGAECDYDPASSPTESPLPHEVRLP